MLSVQIGDERVEAMPADGQTTVDVYAWFFWNDVPIPPERSTGGKYEISFLAGKGALSDDGTIQTPKSLSDRMVPLEGVQIDTSPVTPKYWPVNVDRGLEVIPCARIRIGPFYPDETIDEITVVAYTTYDRRGEIERFAFDYVTLPVNIKSGTELTFLKVAERYDVVQGSWERLPDMQESRVAPMACSLNGKVHVFGGYDGAAFLSSHEIYDPSVGEWSYGEPLQHGGADYAVAYGNVLTYGGKAYLVGGMNYGGCSRGVACYDPISGSWSDYPDMPQGIAMGSAAVVGDSIVVLYGANAVSILPEGDSIRRFNLGVFSYDLTTGHTGQWQIQWPNGSVVETRSLQGGASAGQVLIETSVNPTASYGIAIINAGQPNEERVCFLLNSRKGVFSLAGPLVHDHQDGESFQVISLSKNLISPNALVQDGKVRIFNGLSFSSQSSSTGPGVLNGQFEEWDPAGETLVQLALSPTFARSSAGYAEDGDAGYLIGGSGSKSEWLNDSHSFDEPSGSFAVLPDMEWARNNLGVAHMGQYVYALGGGGSGHPPGWLRLNVAAAPARVRADGRETSGIVVSALDASGDPPPDGIQFAFRGHITLPASSSEATGEDTVEPRNAMDRISILPVLFSAKSASSLAGEAGTVLLERSEDPIREVEALKDYVLENEAFQDQQELRSYGEAQSQSIRNLTAGEERELYVSTVEVSVVDDFYFGTTDTDGAIFANSFAAQKDKEGNATARAKAAMQISSDAAKGLRSDSFALVKSPAKQGLSAIVEYYSDIASLPDVSTVTSEPVTGTAAKALLEQIREDTPFGASPLYDALLAGAEKRLSSAADRNVVIGVSDNDQSLSVASPAEITDVANAVAGAKGCPVFVNTFVITDPVTLAARRSRTDVADLEEISSETGGNSFSVLAPSYVQFVIDRTMASAPSSLASATVIGDYALDGPLTEIQYLVSGFQDGDEATMSLWFSEDGYNYSDIGVKLAPDSNGLARHVFETPQKPKFVRYSLSLASHDFGAPRLSYVAFKTVNPTVKYIFTYPQTVSGQVAELAAVVNHRLPKGASVEIGLVHGDSCMFERDFVSVAQPAIQERGVIVAVNRSFDTYVDSVSTMDVLETEDYRVYVSPSGRWTLGSMSVLVNGSAVLPTEYDAYPHEGTIVFHTARKPGDLVQITDVIQPSRFRVGLKVTNPTLQEGYIDSFAFSWTGTEEQSGGGANRTPRAVGPYISPRPTLPSDTIRANYTFIDPDGDVEDLTKTEITWYRNGVPVPELSNKREFSQRDFVRHSAGKAGLAKGQEWFFSVRPSDGKSYGPLVVSPKIRVSNTPPSIDVARLTSSNANPTLFTSDDVISVKSSASDADGDSVGNNIYNWYVNGVLEKSGPESAIAPGEKRSDGTKLLSPNSSIACEIVPYDGTEYGDPYVTETVEITAAPPSVGNVHVIPATPTVFSNLQVKYVFADPDERRDQSIIEWFRNGQRISELDDSHSVPSVMLSPGDEWYATITPNNGLASGNIATSNTVKISI